MMQGAENSIRVGLAGQPASCHNHGDAAPATQRESRSVFAEPEPTQFDLRWRMLGTHVRVHPLFWLVSALFGSNLLQMGEGTKGLAFLVLWILCVFVSILVHEFGHVLVGKLFGSAGYIILYGMGGLAVGSSDLRNRWKRVAVFLAGPMAGFVLLLLAWFLWIKSGSLSTSLAFRAILLFLLEINLFWGLMNLLPIWPLDGGRVSREVCAWLAPSKGTRAALLISIVAAAVIALNSLSLELAKRPLPLIEHIPFLAGFGDYWIAIFFGYLAVMNYQAMMMERPRRPWEQDQREW
jgi:Zn-dependent protease